MKFETEIKRLLGSVTLGVSSAYGFESINFVFEFSWLLTKEFVVSDSFSDKPVTAKSLNRSEFVEVERYSSIAIAVELPENCTYIPSCSDCVTEEIESPERSAAF